MDAYAKAFWLPKDGSTDGEYEDAFFPRRDRCYPISKRPRFAIADGAAEASFSKLWARLLVSGFVRNALGLPPTKEELKPIRERWEKKVHGRPLQWYAEEKLASGAFASLLGLEFSEEQSETGTERMWRASAAGDSCLVQVRADKTIAAFPLADSSSFNNRPNLLSSLTAVNGDERELVLNFKGTWGCDDTFLLMTDALACWFFKERESDNQPWNLLRDLDTRGQVSFRKLVAGLRYKGAMKNDDVTLVRIDIVG